LAVSTPDQNGLSQLWQPQELR